MPENSIRQLHVVIRLSSVMRAANKTRTGRLGSLPPFIAFLWPRSARRTTHLGRERDLQHHRRRVASFLPPTTRCCSRRGRCSFSSVRRNCGSDPQIYSEFDTRARISRASPFTPSVAGERVFTFRFGDTITTLARGLLLEVKL